MYQNPLRSTKLQPTTKELPLYNEKKFLSLLLLGVSCLSLTSCQTLNLKKQINPLEQLTPSEYYQSPSTNQDVEITRKIYGFKYQFSSPSNERYEWSWKYKRFETDEMIRRFGVPKSIFEPFQANKRNINLRRKVLKKSLYKAEGQIISPDFSQMVPYYMGFTAPLYALTIKTLGRDSSPRERVEFLLRFVQDIPYGIPPTHSNNKVISGVLPPPQIFIEKWADCDSKVLLISSILAHEPRYKILLVYLEKHLLMAFEGRPHRGDKFIIFEGRKFILADPTGPARLPLGNPGSDFNGNFKKVELLNVTAENRRIPHYVSKRIQVRKIEP